MSSLTSDNLLREIRKIADVLEVANVHFSASAQANAALHMAWTTRPAPLAAAVQQAWVDALELCHAMEESASAPVDGEA